MKQEKTEYARPLLDAIQQSGMIHSSKEFRELNDLIEHAKTQESGRIRIAIKSPGYIHVGFIEGLPETLSKQALENTISDLNARTQEEFVVKAFMRGLRAFKEDMETYMHNQKDNEVK